MEFRHERKYLLDNFSDVLMSQSVLMHPAGFKKAFPDRWINNIYFDTPDLVAYHDNVAGVSNRRKYRVRWYGKETSIIKSPKLETKIKDNQLGTKVIEDLPHFSLNDLRETTRAVNKLADTFLPLYPVLLNAYLRSYYTTTDNKFRITVDRLMRYHSLMQGGTFMKFQIHDQRAILELKYSQDLDGHTDRVTQYLPYRQTKSSKYVTGVELTI